MLKVKPPYLKTKLRGFCQKNKFKYTVFGHHLHVIELHLIFEFSEDWPGYIGVLQAYRLDKKYLFYANTMGLLLKKLMTHGLLDPERFKISNQF